MPSNAQNIATTVTVKLAARGVVIPDYLARNLPAICQLFINLTAGTRTAIRSFLTAQDAQIRAYIATTVGWSVQGDLLGQQISILRQGAETILGQIDHVMSTVGLDSVASQSPDLSNLLKSIAEAVPISIPTNVVTGLAGVGGFSFFEGVTDYKSLRNKVDDLVFAAARAVSFSNYARQGSAYANDILDRIEVYITIIDSLDIPITTVTITPATVLNFGNVQVGTITILPIVLQNQGNGTVTIGWTFPGAPFTFVGLPVDQVSQTIFSPISFTLNVQFAPTVVGPVTRLMNITNDAFNGPPSPLTFTIQGVGT